MQDHPESERPDDAAGDPSDPLPGEEGSDDLDLDDAEGFDSPTEADEEEVDEDAP